MQNKFATYSMFTWNVVSFLGGEHKFQEFLKWRAQGPKKDEVNE